MAQTFSGRLRYHLALSSWHLATCAEVSEMKDFRNLMVWEKSHKLTLQIYRATAKFPRSELYGLTSQIRRCRASIGGNIPEGCCKRGNNEFQRYLQIASGSASDLDYHLFAGSGSGISC
jgi:four helix bundle protein